MFPGWLQEFFRLIILNKRSKGTQWSPAIRWSSAIRWSPAIRWSIGSMDFDNRKVYGDTSITDGLVFSDKYLPQRPFQRNNLRGLRWFRTWQMDRLKVFGQPSILSGTANNWSWFFSEVPYHHIMNIYRHQHCQYDCYYHPQPILLRELSTAAFPVIQVAKL